MKFSAIVAFIPAFAAIALASPAPAVTQVASEPAELSKRDVTFTYWNEDNFQGAKGHQTNPVSGKCYGLSATYNDKVSSVGPDRGLRCTIWQDNNCQGNALTSIVYPGIAKLSAYNFNDKMSSWACTYA